MVQQALLIFFLITGMFATGQQKLRVYLDTKQFFAPEVGNYLEVYLQFMGQSVQYLGLENGLQGQIAVKMSIEATNGDSTETIASDAYRLATPFMKDSIVEDFYDVKRFPIRPGKYNLNIVLADLNSTNPPITSKIPIVIDQLGESISFSDIEIAELAYKGDESSPFYKSGLCIIPRLSTFYPAELNTIPVYFELYNTSSLPDSVFGVKQMIINDKGAELPDFTRFTRHDRSTVVPIMRKVDITELTTGKYTLSYTLLSRSMDEIATQSYEFERSNDIDLSTHTENIILDPYFQGSISDDSVTHYLESIIPISKSGEVKNILSTIRTKDLEKQRKHLQAFWALTAPGNSYDTWIKYKQQVQLVERLYGNNFQEGFETDRGRVYLQYGAPTTIVQKENSPNEYPYEIWQYNKIGAFSNKRFVFYNPDLVNNAYRLLHSDMLGELKNPGWPQALSKRNTSSGNVDDPNLFMQNSWGDNSNDLFRQY
jgi:GWxTD domain-containing protein